MALQAKQLFPLLKNLSAHLVQLTDPFALVVQTLQFAILDAHATQLDKVLLGTRLLEHPVHWVALKQFTQFRIKLPQDTQFPALKTKVEQLKHAPVEEQLAQSATPDA